MKTLQKIFKPFVPFALATAVLAGCATTSIPDSSNEPKPIHPSRQEIKGIRLYNGYFVESAITADYLDLITAAENLEIILKKTDKDYKKIPTSLYDRTPTEEWNSSFDDVCTYLDSDRDHFITELQAGAYLDKLCYSMLQQPIWAEED